MLEYVSYSEILTFLVLFTKFSCKKNHQRGDAALCCCSDSILLMSGVREVLGCLLESLNPLHAQERKLKSCHTRSVHSCHRNCWRSCDV